MILKLTSKHDVAVLEMGMSDLGEIKILAEAAEPDMAVITNIGSFSFGKSKDAR